MNDYRFYKKKNINTWFDDKTRVVGASKYNAPFIRAYKQMDAELGRNNMICMFAIRELGIRDVNSMLRSGMKQRRLVGKVIGELKKYKLTEEYVPGFQGDLVSIEKRIQWVFKILKENIRLTEYYPFFESTGFERLVDFAFEQYESDEASNRLMEEITEYLNSHAEEVAAYVISIQHDIDVRDAHRVKIAEDRKREKEAAKQLRRDENNEIKEMRKNEKIYKQREKKIDRSFERYYEKRC